MRGQAELLRVNIMLAPGDVRRLDDWAQDTGHSRSALIREAIRRYRPQPAAPPRSRGELTAALQDLRARIRPFDTVAAVRRWRDRR